MKKKNEAYTTEIIDKLRFYENAIKVAEKEDTKLEIVFKEKTVPHPSFFTEFKVEDDMYKAFLSYLKTEALKTKEQLKKNLDIESYIYKDER